jgi:hypothetical protein
MTEAIVKTTEAVIESVAITQTEVSPAHSNASNSDNGYEIWRQVIDNSLDGEPEVVHTKAQEYLRDGGKKVARCLRLRLGNACDGAEAIANTKCSWLSDEEQ